MQSEDGTEDADEDHHADEAATVDDERISVEESGLGIDIVRERYALVKYDSPERWFDWVEDEVFHVRADSVPALLEGIEAADVEYQEKTLDQLQVLSRQLGSTEHDD